MDKTLQPLAVEGADAQQIADSAIATWARIDAALLPVMGRGGSAALYRRSLHLTRAQYPWLAAAYAGTAKPGDFASLRLVLSQQNGVGAAGAHDAMVQTLHVLLSDLVGRSLTDRLLQPVWETPLGGNAAQEAAP